MPIFSDPLWANILSAVSLGLSAGSLIYARGAYYRDQPKLKIEAGLVLADDHPGYIQVKATSIGGRPISLVQVWGRNRTAATGFYFKNHLGPGVRLEQHAVHDFRVTYLPRELNDFAADGVDGNDDVFDFEEMWVQDARGDRHPITGMKGMLPDLHAHYKEWCRRTNYWRNAPTPEPMPSPVEPLLLNPNTSGN